MPRSRARSGKDAFYEPFAERDDFGALGVVLAADEIHRERRLDGVVGERDEPAEAEGFVGGGVDQGHAEALLGGLHHAHVVVDAQGAVGLGTESDRVQRVAGVLLELFQADQRERGPTGTCW